MHQLLSKLKEQSLFLLLILFLLRLTPSVVFAVNSLPVSVIQETVSNRSLQGELVQALPPERILMSITIPGEIPPLLQSQPQRPDSVFYLQPTLTFKTGNGISTREVRTVQSKKAVTIQDTGLLTRLGNLN